MRQFGGSRDRAPFAAGRHLSIWIHHSTVCLSFSDSELLVKGLSGETAEMSRDLKLAHTRNEPSCPVRPWRSIERCLCASRSYVMASHKSHRRQWQNAPLNGRLPAKRASAERGLHCQVWSSFMCASKVNGRGYQLLADDWYLVLDVEVPSLLIMCYNAMGSNHKAPFRIKQVNMDGHRKA